MTPQVNAAQMFDGDGEDDSGGGVATLDAEESSRPSGEEYRREYPNKKFVAETLEAFPEAGVADVEQARVRTPLSSSTLPPPPLLLMHPSPSCCAPILRRLQGGWWTGPPSV